MRHQKAGRKLGMNTSHRLAMLRNMVTSLIVYDRIKTTDTRAKELKRIADKMVTLGKRGDLHARRVALRFIRLKSAAKKLFEEIAPRFKDRQGGYTRIIKVKRRLGDNAPVSIIEFTEMPKAEAKDDKQGKKKKPAEKKKDAEGKKKGAADKREKEPKTKKAPDWKRAR
jgi:large subunit ribosomal protein L17